MKKYTTEEVIAMMQDKAARMQAVETQAGVRWLPGSAGMSLLRIDDTKRTAVIVLSTSIIDGPGGPWSVILCDMGNGRFPALDYESAIRSAAMPHDGKPIQVGATA